MEIKGTFVNENEKGSGRQTDYRLPMYDITASYLKDLDFSSQPGNKLCLGGLIAVFFSSSRALTVQHAFTKQAMKGATPLTLRLLMSNIYIWSTYS